MTTSIVSPDVEEAWLAAQRDAGVTHLGVRLYPYTTQPPRDMPTAVLCAPNVLVGDDAGVLTRAQRDDSDRHIGHHRLLLYTGASDDALAAKLRHELEHVVQWEEKGQAVFDLYMATSAGLDTFIPEDRRGSGMLYNAVPLEADANAAAARFMRARLGDTRADELAESDEGVLFRSQPAPESAKTAGRRTVCFAALGAERVEEWLGPYPGGGRSLIDGLAEDPGLWDELQNDRVLRERVVSARRFIPTAADMRAAAPDFREPWRPLREALLGAYLRAREIADLACT